MFFDRKSRGKWRQRCFGKGKKTERENRICSRSDDRIKVAAQEEGWGESNRKLGAWVQFLVEIISLEALAGCLALWRAAAAVRTESPMPCGIVGHSGSLHSTEIPRKSATRLVWEEEGGWGVSRTVTAVKTSPHPTTSPKSSGEISATRPRFQSSVGCTRGRWWWWWRLLVARCTGSGFSLPLSVCLSLSFSLSAFPIGECQVPEPGVW